MATLPLSHQEAAEILLISRVKEGEPDKSKFFSLKPERTPETPWGRSSCNVEWLSVSSDKGDFEKDSELDSWNCDL